MKYIYIIAAAGGLVLFVISLFFHLIASGLYWVANRFYNLTESTTDKIIDNIFDPLIAKSKELNERRSKNVN